MVLIAIQQTVPSNAQTIMTLLLDHQNLANFFNARFKVIKTQAVGERVGGKGTIREVTILGTRFNEEIITATDHLIRYKIVGDKPVKQHAASIELFPRTDGCDIHYQVQFVCPWYLPNKLISFAVTCDIKRALKRLAEVAHAS